MTEQTVENRLGSRGNKIYQWLKLGWNFQTD